VTVAEKIPYQIIRSARKTVAIQITPEGRVLVRCPRRMAIRDVERFVQSKAAWIQKHLARTSEAQSLPKFSLEEIQALAETARKVIPERVAYFGEKMGISYGSVTIRCQHTRWGSCSSKGNLNFNCLLMLAPPEVIDYVIVHELCHRLEMNHSQQFWGEVEKVMPDYRERKCWLKDNGGALMGRLPGREKP
jgi:predicted metal-dependent hydrolase